MSEWQTIESAPKDGTAVWLLVDGHPYIGFGEPAGWAWSDREKEKWFAKATFKRRDPEERARRELADEIYSCNGTDVAPTHWMPLPEPAPQTNKAATSPVRD